MPLPKLFLPVFLFRYFLQYLGAEPDALIADCFMGTGYDAFHLLLTLTAEAAVNILAMLFIPGVIVFFDTLYCRSAA
jgi:hypothetical protein